MPNAKAIRHLSSDILGADHEDGARGVAQDVFGGAAEDGVFQSEVAVGAGHDQAGVLLAGVVDDLRAGSAFEDDFAIPGLASGWQNWWSNTRAFCTQRRCWRRRARWVRSPGATVGTTCSQVTAPPADWMKRRKGRKRSGGERSVAKRTFRAPKREGAVAAIGALRGGPAGSPGRRRLGGRAAFINQGAGVARDTRPRCYPMKVWWNRAMGLAARWRLLAVF